MDVSTEPDSNDVKQLRAAARASFRTGAAVTLRQWVGNGERLMKTLDILEAEGADLTRSRPLGSLRLDPRSATHRNECRKGEGQAGR